MLIFTFLDPNLCVDLSLFSPFTDILSYRNFFPALSFGGKWNPAYSMGEEFGFFVLILLPERIFKLILTYSVNH